MALFSLNDVVLSRSADDATKRKALRLIMEGNASEDMAAIARGFIADLTGFFNSQISERPAEAVLEARRIGATIYDMTFMTVEEIDRHSRPSELEEPFSNESD